MSSGLADSGPQVKTESPEAKLRTQLSSFAFASPDSEPSPLRRSSRKPAPRRWATNDILSDDEDNDELPQVAASSSKKRRLKEEEDEVKPKASSSSRKRVKKEEDLTPKSSLRRTPSTISRKRAKTEEDYASPAKKAKAGYAPPETYAHLSPLPDHLIDELDVMFCGFNPGEMSAETGHHFGNPTNAFWRSLHGSGLTTAEKALHPSEDGTMPERFSLGLTNLVTRPTNSANELSAAEMRAGAATVLAKAARYRPRVVCYVGNQIADIMYEAVIKTHLKLPSGRPSDIPPRVAKRKNAPPRHGLEPYKIMHAEGSGAVRETLFFIMGSTSGRVANYGSTNALPITMSRASPIIADLHLAQMPAKIKAFSDLKTCVEDAKAGQLDTSAFALVDTRSLEAEIEVLRAKADLADAGMKAELGDAEMKVDLVETTMKAKLVDGTIRAELVDAKMDVKVEPHPAGLLAMPAEDLKPMPVENLKPRVAGSNVCVDASSRRASLKEEDDSVKAEDDSVKAEDYMSSQFGASVKQEDN